MELRKLVQSGLKVNGQLQLSQGFSRIQPTFDAVVKIILPAFTEWLSRILALPENSPVLHGEPYFDAAYDNGKIAIGSNFEG